MAEKRIEWVDIAKGIGIICVVIGHTEISDTLFGRIIYLFHMPLFFYISGYLYKKQENMKAHLKNKSIQLLIPYFVFLFIFTPVNGLSDLLNNTSLSISDIISFVLKILSGGKNIGGATTVFWFITCFYLTQILYNLLHNKFSEKSINYIAVVMLILGYLSPMLIADINIPWNANVVLVALPVYHIGYLSRKFDLTINNYILSIVIICIVVLAAFIPDIDFDMKDSHYGIPVLSLVCSLFLITFVKKISYYVASSNTIVKQILEQIGKASLIIMYFHMLILISLGKMGFNNNLINIFIALALSYTLYYFIGKFRISRALLLGSKEDLYSLMERNK